MYLLPSPAKAETDPLVTFWCTLHQKFDVCYWEYNCPQHPNMNSTFGGRDCICSLKGKQWNPFKAVDIVPDCPCSCHNYQRMNHCCSGHCCARSRPVAPCPCVCHTVWHEGCSEYQNKCCPTAKGAGETDEQPRLFDPLEPIYGSEYPMETVHLNMTIEGGELVKDLFHLILHHCDKDYPIKPMRKAGDNIRICQKCKGLEWNACGLTPEYLQKAARQASRVMCDDVRVKVHSWRRGLKCGGNVVAHPLPEFANAVTLSSALEDMSE